MRTINHTSLEKNKSWPDKHELDLNGSVIELNCIKKEIKITFKTWVSERTEVTTTNLSTD
jgi:hypothetical protein